MFFFINFEFYLKSSLQAVRPHLTLSIDRQMKRIFNLIFFLNLALIIIYIRINQIYEI